MAHFPKAACDCSARHFRAVKTSLRSQATKNGAAFFGIAEGAVFVGLDSAMPRAEPSVAAFWGKMRARVEHLCACTAYRRAMPACLAVHGAQEPTRGY